MCTIDSDGVVREVYSWMQRVRGKTNNQDQRGRFLSPLLSADNVAPEGGSDEQLLCFVGKLG